METPNFMREKGFEPSYPLWVPDPKISAASLTHGAYRGKRTARALHAVAQNSTESHGPCDIPCNMERAAFRPALSPYARRRPALLWALVLASAGLLVLGGMP